MTQSFFDGISVIVPTWNRADLLNSMLESLHREIESYEGECEVIVVDSSEGEQKDAIVESCTRYGALYCEGDQSVRRKRNLGVDRSRFELLLFLDSDIVVEPGILKAHVEAYNKGGFIGAVQGLTRFVGKGGVFWKTAELSGLVDSFSNAEKYPFQSWSITNNLSVRKKVFYEIGRFNENFPFKLGGDDLEMSYRIAHAGYMIASAPNAIALHSKATWDNPKALMDRTKRWGTMESKICELHPELYKLVIPKNYVFELPFFVLFAAWALVTQSVLPLIALAFTVLLLISMRYVRECRKHRRLINPIYLAAACLINLRYEFFRLRGFAAEGKATAFMHGMVFNLHQIRGSFAPDASRLNWLFATYAVIILFCGVMSRVF